MPLMTPSNLKTVKLKVDGIEEYLEKIKKAGGDIVETVKEAIGESAKPIHEDIRIWAEKHKMTGATLKGVSLDEVKVEGNDIYVDVGIDTTLSPLSWHAVFVEFGTPKQAADPGIRPAFDNNKSKVKKIQKTILAKGGVPVD